MWMSCLNYYSTVWSPSLPHACVDFWCRKQMPLLLIDSWLCRNISVFCKTVVGYCKTCMVMNSHAPYKIWTNICLTLKKVSYNSKPLPSFPVCFGSKGILSLHDQMDLCLRSRLSTSIWIPHRFSQSWLPSLLLGMKITIRGFIFKNYWK